MSANAVVSQDPNWIPGEPLTKECPNASWSFLRRVLPDPIFSGSAREKGYAVFYRLEHPEGEPITQALRGQAPIRRYLESQLKQGVAEHWFSVQSTQFSDTGRNTGDKTRHLAYIVLDLDGGRMSPDLLSLRRSDFPAFLTQLDSALHRLGVESYYLVVSSSDGLHVYLPLANSRTGRLLGANYKTLNDWKRTSDGLRLALQEFGTDSNAVRVTQPFILPGLPRLKHPGFVPYFAGGRDGSKSDMYTLLNTLTHNGYAQPERRAHLTVHRTDRTGFLTQLLHEIQQDARGFEHGGKGTPARNVAAHRIATYLVAKGADAAQAWDALMIWNERNTPALSERELDKCLHNAITDKAKPQKAKMWAQMAAAPWNKARAFLRLPPIARRIYNTSRAKTREDRQRDHYGEVAERTLRYVRDQATVTMKQQELADLLNTNRSTLRIVLQALLDAGKITIVTTRGRNGKTVITYTEKKEATSVLELNVHRDIVQSAPLNPDDGAPVRPSTRARAGGFTTNQEVTQSPSPALLVGWPAEAVANRENKGNRDDPGGQLLPAVAPDPGKPIIARRKGRKALGRRFIRLARAAGLVR